MAMVVIATSMSTGLTLTTRLRFIIHKHITMDMDNLMSTRTAIIITDLMDMRLITIIRRDLLLLSLDMDMEDTVMSTELLRDLLKDIMARDLLSLDMVTVPESAITTEVPRVFRDMAIIRDLLNLDMVTVPESAITTEVP